MSHRHALLYQLALKYLEQRKEFFSSSLKFKTINCTTRLKPTHYKVSWQYPQISGQIKSVLLCWCVSGWVGGAGIWSKLSYGADLRHNLTQFQTYDRLLMMIFPSVFLTQLLSLQVYSWIAYFMQKYGHFKMYFIPATYPKIYWSYYIINLILSTSSHT